MPDENGHPDVGEMELGAIFAALADPVRRKVVLALAADGGCIRHCSAFDLPVTKATRTHHFRVLRESGLIRQVDLGNSRTNQLRWSDLEARFPDLLRLLVCEAAAERSKAKGGVVPGA
ncbi:DNA-binding transcriptional ArsR family regulator [Ancylobacter aquaticus]|uniref:DNA-binding transcriptional ArsR family regulator n=1 Tax=Ancylobacter aquaticus TaxID=100 RepID=A0A4R1HQC5_ANCAQ|nr:helix-turn-helix transcriptional regulator [Ancylobacter aquaticus]TCK23441.1 DNA-binding transcriptional ArsR family regulator [Ancylobacter aquaticus]